MQQQLLLVTKIQHESSKSFMKPLRIISSRDLSLSWQLCYHDHGAYLFLKLSSVRFHDRWGGQIILEDSATFAADSVLYKILSLVEVIPRSSALASCSSALCVPGDLTLYSSLRNPELSDLLFAHALRYLIK